MGPLSININTSAAKTVAPMINDGEWVELRLTALEGASNEKGDYLKWKWELVNPAPSVASAKGEGDPIFPGKMGSIIFENIQLYSKPDSKDPDWFKKKIAVRLDGLLGTGDAENKKGKPARPDLTSELVPQLLGKTIRAKMKVKTGEFEGNEIGNIMFPGDVQA